MDRLIRKGGTGTGRAGAIQRPRSPRLATVLAGLLLSSCALAVAGCSGDSAAAISGEDARAIAQLGEIAARDAEIAGAPGAVECWVPSRHGIGGSKFRVICRVHYEQSGVDRYRDMICVGEWGRDPIARSCYQWAYYSEAPEFGDHPAYQRFRG
ncbi:MAG: hypothetical protein ACK5LO_12645 [Leucobacter sp.]